MNDQTSKFRYECLKRSRVAKHEVLSRILRRKVSDGKWLDIGGFYKISRDELGPALTKLREMRDKLSQGGVKRDEGQCKFLDHFPDVEIGYDERKQSHYIIL